jgi:hypothetical protein
MEKASVLDGAVPATRKDPGSGIYGFPAIGALLMALAAGYAGANDRAWLGIAVIAFGATVALGLTLFVIDDDEKQATRNKAVGYTAVAMLSLAWALFRGQFPQQEIMWVVGGAAALTGLLLWTYVMVLVHRGYPAEGRNARYRTICVCGGFLLVAAGAVDFLTTGSEAALALTAPGVLMAGVGEILRPIDKKAAKDK